MQTYEDGRYRDLTLTLAKAHHYRGRSVGSEQTCHQFPGYKFCFDVGGAPLSSTVIPSVFITHGHDDHVGGLISHAVRRGGWGRGGWGLDPADYWIPEWDFDAVRGLVDATRRLSRARGDISLNKIEEGQEVPVGGGLTIKGYRSFHTIPCMGYTAWSARRRLKAEFAKLPGHELGKLRREGRDLDEIVQIPEISFPGDTNIKVLEHDQVRKARVLLLECTFIDGVVSPKDTFRAGHIHLDHIVEALADGSLENDEILFTHFSARYEVEYIRATVSKALRGVKGSERVTLLLPERRRRDN